MVVTHSSNENGIEIHCDPGYPLTWRREPYFQQINEWSVAARQHDGTVMVCVGYETTLIAPEGEFSLGKVHDDDRIIQEYNGSRLTGVRVVKASELENLNKEQLGVEG